MPSQWLQFQRALPVPGKGIATDIHGRLPWYRDDWKQGLNWGLKVLAPATYIFFASALPALAFGQQLAIDTEGTLSVVHVLVATALAGLIQSVLGGQPLLIIGVAEPIVLIYGFVYNFCKHTPGLGTSLFLPWAGWVCVWTSLMCLLLALSGACAGIDKFTRFSGEVFGALIAILFFQVGVKGVVHEFQPAPEESAVQPAPGGSAVTADSNLLLINGLWGLFLACGVLLTSLKVLKARGWLLGRGWLRGFLADYGVPLMIVAWSGLSFAVHPAPGVPRRVETPNTWEVTGSWSVASRMHLIPGSYVAAALLPALIITVLFYFDHNVSSQLAQQPEFGLVKPAAYHYDFLLLALLTLACGLLGIPPVNGVLPQAPMHTRSLAHLRKRQRPPAAGQPQVSGTLSLATAAPTHAGDSIDAANGGAGPTQLPVVHVVGPGGLHQATPADVALEQEQRLEARLESRTSCELRHRSHHTPLEQQKGKQQEQEQEQHYAQNHAAVPGHQWQHPPEQRQRAKPSDSEVALNTLPDSADAVVGVGDEPAAAAAKKDQDGQYLQLEVREQRVSNLLQSLLVAVCLGITPAIKQIPTAVLWGYFIFMAVESLTGSQLWERCLLLLTDPRKRVAVLQQEHAAYLQLVPFAVVARFTIFQVVYLLGVWALTTWAGIAGVAFPVPIMALVPVRQYLLPRFFKQQHLAELDAASYEEAPAISDRVQAAQELYALGAITEAPAPALPVSTGGLSGQGSMLSPSVDSDETEIMAQEFLGHRLKHHVTQRELQQHRPH